jgi:hypothetical protein
MRWAIVTVGDWMSPTVKRESPSRRTRAGGAGQKASQDGSVRLILSLDHKLTVWGPGGESDFHGPGLLDCIAICMRERNLRRLIRRLIFSTAMYNDATMQTHARIRQKPDSRGARCANSNRRGAAMSPNNMGCHQILNVMMSPS